MKKFSSYSGKNLKEVLNKLSLLEDFNVESIMCHNDKNNIPEDIDLNDYLAFTIVYSYSEKVNEVKPCIVNECDEELRNRLRC